MGLKERPVLFSAPMVRAILAGRKTQTRRVVTGQKALAPGATQFERSGWVANDAAVLESQEATLAMLKCPYGVPGDRLWVRETWRPRVTYGACDSADVNVTYAADGVTRFFSESKIPDEWCLPKAATRTDVTPLHMPRWASRITLEITGVRVERLQAITEEDARAEGVERSDLPATGVIYGNGCITARGAFAELWDSLNGERAPWSSNPWVWVLTLRRLEAPCPP